MQRLSYGVIILIMGISLFLSKGLKAEEVTDARLLNAQQDKANWLLYGHDYTNQRYSLLDQIRTDNVKNLVLKWIYQTGKIGSFQTNPLVVNGIMYVTTPYTMWWPWMPGPASNSGVMNTSFEPRNFAVARLIEELR